MGKVLTTLTIDLQNLIDDEEDDRVVIDFRVGDRVTLVSTDINPLDGWMRNEEGTIEAFLPNGFIVCEMLRVPIRQPLAESLGYGEGYVIVPVSNIKGGADG